MNKEELKNELEEPIDKLDCIDNFGDDINYLLYVVEQELAKPENKTENDKFIKSFIRQAREKANDVSAFAHDVKDDLDYIGEAENE